MPVCRLCTAPLSASHAVLALRSCYVCRVLARCGIPYRAPDALQSELLPARVSKVRRRLRIDWTRGAVCDAVTLWIAAHDNMPPTAVRFCPQERLPAYTSVFRLWGGLAAFYQEYADGGYLEAYTALVLASRQKGPAQVLFARGWTPERIAMAVLAWIAAHQGQVPMSGDFKQVGSSGLPSARTVYRYHDSLAGFYAELAGGVHAVQFLRQSAANRARGGKARRGTKNHETGGKR